MTAKRWIAGIVLTVVALLLLLWLLLWLVRAQIAARFAQSYFRSHGIESSVEIGTLGLSGGTGRFALGPRANPTVSAERIELYFDPQSWIPRVVEVRLVAPLVRARLDESGKVRLEALQDWIDSLQQSQGKSRFVSDDLAVSLTGLRLLLATPSGALDVGGDVKLVRNLPVSALLRIRPATITHQALRVQLRDASLNYNASGLLSVRFAGSVQKDALTVQDTVAAFDASGLKWTSAETLSLSATSARLQFSAASLTAGQNFTAPKADVTVRNLSASLGREIGVAGDIAVAAGAHIKPVVIKALKAQDPALANAIAANMGHLNLAFAGHAERRGNQTRFVLTTPLTVKSARDAMLHIPMLTLDGAPDSLSIALNASLSGRGIPAVKLSSERLTWRDGGLTGDATLSARFNYAMLRGMNMAAHGGLSWRDGRYGFRAFCRHQGAGSQAEAGQRQAAGPHQFRHRGQGGRASSRYFHAGEIRRLHKAGRRSGIRQSGGGKPFGRHGGRDAQASRIHRRKASAHQGHDRRCHRARRCRIRCWRHQRASDGQGCRSGGPAARQPGPAH